MTPPGAQGDRHIAGAPDAHPAVSVCPPPAVATLLNRPDFLKAASARRQGTASFLLQGRDRRDGDGLIRVGFTASKKTGNAVTRNRAKRRLRAAAQEMVPRLGRPGWDYVLVARPGATVTRLFADLLRDLEAALAAVHGGGKAGRG